MNYEESLKYLSTLSQFGMNFGLERINRLTELMQHPERRFKTIHITGSNGKGSVAAMLAAILSQSGVKTGLYISPHLDEYTERMTINGSQIRPEEFANAIEYTSKFVEQMLKEGLEHPTEFEVLTAAAFYYFACSGAEYVVLEAGLGGLLDSTNVVIPAISVITNVTLEHTDRCGETIAEIAGHKAGIIKDNIPVVTAARGEALEVIKDTAAIKNSQVLVYQEDFSSKSEGLADGAAGNQQKVTVDTKNMGSISAKLNLLGLHQLENSAVAVATALRLSQDESRITSQTIQNGLKIVEWPGRFEVVIGQQTIIIDGAHNPDGATVLRKNLDRFFPGKDITFVLGILRDKDVRGIIKNLIRPEDQVVTIQPESYRAATAEEIANLVEAKHVEAAVTIEDGIRLAKQLATSQGIVCVAGSLYTLGSARKAIYS